MKSIIKSMILYFGFVVSVLSSDALGIINDPFFTHPDTIVTFRSLIPHEDKYMAVIDGSTTDETRSTSLVPFFKNVYIANNEKKSSDHMIEATVLCGTRTLERSMTLLRGIPYVYLRDIEEKSGELTVGGTVTFSLYKEYKRAGEEVPFREHVRSLYDLKMTLERVSATDVAVCVKEWTITSKWQRKTRHKRNHYSAMDIYHIITKYPSSAGNITAQPPEELSRFFVRKELRFKTTEAESPECGNNGGNLPAGAVIIN